MLKSRRATCVCVIEIYVWRVARDITISQWLRTISHFPILILNLCMCGNGDLELNVYRGLHISEFQWKRNLFSVFLFVAESREDKINHLKYPMKYLLRHLCVRSSFSLSISFYFFATRSISTLRPITIIYANKFTFQIRFFFAFPVGSTKTGCIYLWFSCQYLHQCSRVRVQHDEPNM